MFDVKCGSLSFFRLVDFILDVCFFQNGNDFGDTFDELQYVMKSVIVIKLRVEEPKPTFDPPFRECRDIILRCFSEIIESGGGLPRVSATVYQRGHQRVEL